MILGGKQYKQENLVNSIIRAEKLFYYLVSILQWVDPFVATTIFSELNIPCIPLHFTLQKMKIYTNFLLILIYFSCGDSLK
jgi:hypothetical protein